MTWDNNDEVLVKHDGIKVDRNDLGAVLFYLESEEESEEEGTTWIPRSLLGAYNEKELWIPRWKAEKLGCDYD